MMDRFDGEIPDDADKKSGVFSLKRALQSPWWKFACLGLSFFIFSIILTIVAVRTSRESDNNDVIESSEANDSWTTPSPSPSSSPEINQASPPPTLSIDSSSPPHTSSIPLPLQDRDEFSHFIVQWGIETQGCYRLQWPSIFLSCGEEFGEASIDVVDMKLPAAFNDLDDESRPNIECTRKVKDAIVCKMKNSQVQYSHLNASSSLLYGSLLVVCGGNSSKDEASSEILSQYHLKADILPHTFATSCLDIKSITTLNKDQEERVNGGYAMPWLSVGRFCHDSTNGGNRRQRNLQSPTTAQRKMNPQDHLRTRATTGALDDNNFQDRLKVLTDMYCEQGEHFSAAGGSGAKDFCVQQSQCTSSRIYAPGEDIWPCTGSLACDIPSGAINSNTVYVARDITKDDTNPNSCGFSQVLPNEWMWTVAEDEQVLSHTPTMTINND